MVGVKRKILVLGSSFSIDRGHYTTISNGSLPFIDVLLTGELDMRIDGIQVTMKG